MTVSNALLMYSATVIVRSGGLFWLNPVAMVLFMLCSACRVVALEAILCGMLFVMYGGSVFSSVLRSLREMRWVCTMCLCSCLCLGLCLVLELV